MKPFAATARLQFHEAFTMDDATATLCTLAASSGVVGVIVLTRILPL